MTVVTRKIITLEAKTKNISISSAMTAANLTEVEDSKVVKADNAETIQDVVNVEIG